MLLRFPTKNEVAYIFPKSDDFEKHWEDALLNSNGAYQVYSDIRSIYQWIEAAQIFEEDPLVKLRALESNTTDFYPILIAFPAIAEFEINDGSHYNMRAAIHLVDRFYQNSIDRNWYYVTPFCLEMLVSLQDRLSYDCTLELQRAVDQLQQLVDMDDVPLSTFGDLVRLLLDNPHILENEARMVTQAVGLCIQLCNKLRMKKDYRQERDVLKETIELANLIDADLSGLQRRYVDTYRLNSVEQGKRSSMLEANELLTGLNDEIVQNILSDDEKKIWKNDLRDAAEKAARNLKNNGAKLDYHQDDDVYKRQIEHYIECFEQIASAEDTQAALFWLLTENKFLPNPDQRSENAPLLERISTMGLSYSGHMIEFDPEDADISSHYIIDTMIRIPILVSVFSSLISSEQLFEADLYDFINQCPDVEPNDNYYLTKIISNLFENRHAESIHLGIPQMESILYSHLRARGEDVDALMEEGTGTRTLGSLLPITKQYLGDQFGSYLQYMYNKPAGQLLLGNLRNRVAHGLLLPGENNQYLSLLILIDLLRLIARFNNTHFHGEYGIPTTVTYGPMQYKLALIPYRNNPSISDNDLLEFIESNAPIIEEVANHFDISYPLAHSRIRVLEAVDKIEITPKNEDYLCQKL